MHSDVAYASDRFLSFFFLPTDPRSRPAGTFITLDVRISISRRCTTGRRGNKFLCGIAGYTRRYVRVIPLPGPASKICAGQRVHFMSSRGPFTSDVLVSILITSTTFRDALPAISPTTISGNYSIVTATGYS